MTENVYIFCIVMMFKFSEQVIKYIYKTSECKTSKGPMWQQVVLRLFFNVEIHKGVVQILQFILINMQFIVIKSHSSSLLNLFTYSKISHNSCCLKCCGHSPHKLCFTSQTCLLHNDLYDI